MHIHPYPMTAALPQTDLTFRWSFQITAFLIANFLSVLLPPAVVIAQRTSIASTEQANGKRPNIIFIMTDDQGYWDTGVSGNPSIDTPNMDRTAMEGIQLRRYYAAPVCAPTRAGIMTGRHYLRTGLYNTRFGGDTLGGDELTVAELLKNSGYRTGLFGKWHLGKYPGYQPQDRGFDEFMGHYHGHIERYEFPDQIYHNGRRVKARGYVSELFTDATNDFVEKAYTDGVPFFCCLMFNAPHSPWLLDTSHYGQPEGDKLLSKYLEKGLPIREARIYSLIERVDSNIGRLLKHLENLGIEDNTLLVFTSDNGGVSKHWKGGMSGNKASTYEGGVRAPCYVRWPDRIEAGSMSDSLTSHIDWLPTFCEIAGTQTPNDRTIDGKSLVKLFTQDTNADHHEYVFHTWDRYTPNPNRRWAISDQRWKLMCIVGEKATASENNWKLFDLSNDPGEKRNLRATHPEITTRMRTAFTDWFSDVTHGIEYRPIPIPVSPNPEQVTELSPSWSKWKGPNVQYTFDGYDWDTIDSWKAAGESAEWHLSVLEAGQYEVELTYGCNPNLAGASLRLQAGEHFVIHRIQPTVTSEQFETFSAGQLWLDSGNQQLSAVVEDSSESEIMRLNQITLRRLD